MAARTVEEWDRILQNEEGDEEETPEPLLTPELLRAFASTSDKNILPDAWKSAHDDLCTRFSADASATRPISQSPLGSILDSQITTPQIQDGSESDSS